MTCSVLETVGFMDSGLLKTFPSFHIDTSIHAPVSSHSSHNENLSTVHELCNWKKSQTLPEYNHTIKIMLQRGLQVLKATCTPCILK